MNASHGQTSHKKIHNFKWLIVETCKQIDQNIMWTISLAMHLHKELADFVN